MNEITVDQEFTERRKAVELILGANFQKIRGAKFVGRAKEEDQTWMREMGFSFPVKVFGEKENLYYSTLTNTLEFNLGEGRFVYISKGEHPRKDVQSVLFEIKRWTVEQAKTWLQDHEYKSSKVDTTEEHHRFRQFEPGLCAEGSYATITFGKGIKAIICKKKSVELTTGDAMQVNTNTTTTTGQVGSISYDHDLEVEPQPSVRIGGCDVDKYRTKLRDALDAGSKVLVTRMVDSEVREFNDEDMTLVATVSTGFKDRMGDIVRPEGINLKWFKKNPVVLWAHDYSSLPIAKALWVKQDGKNVISKMKFDRRPEATEIFRLYKEGFLNAFSIGFVPVEYEMMTSDEGRLEGFDFKKSDLLEFPLG